MGRMCALLGKQEHGYHLYISERKYERRRGLRTKELQSVTIVTDLHIYMQSVTLQSFESQCYIHIATVASMEYPWRLHFILSTAKIVMHGD